jgi:hypothetical protein
LVALALSPKLTAAAGISALPAKFASKPAEVGLPTKHNDGRSLHEGYFAQQQKPIAAAPKK